MWIVNESAEKSGLPAIAAMIGVIRSVTSAVTSAAAAMPTTIPTAMSTRLPRSAKSRNSSSSFFIEISSVDVNVCPRLSPARAEKSTICKACSVYEAKGGSMYATLRYYTGHALADALATRESDVRQVIAGIDGFRAYYLVRTADDSTVTVSVFDDQAGAEESTRAAAAWVAENLADLNVSPPRVTGGEVVFSL